MGGVGGEPLEGEKGREGVRAATTTEHEKLSPTSLFASRAVCATARACALSPASRGVSAVSTPCPRIVRPRARARELETTV